MDLLRFLVPSDRNAGEIQLVIRKFLELNPISLCLQKITLLVRVLRRRFVFFVYLKKNLKSNAKNVIIKLFVVWAE